MRLILLPFYVLHQHVSDRVRSCRIDIPTAASCNALPHSRTLEDLPTYCKAPVRKASSTLTHRMANYLDMPIRSKHLPSNVLRGLGVRSSVTHRPHLFRDRLLLPILALCASSRSFSMFDTSVRICGRQITVLGLDLRFHKGRAHKRWCFWVRWSPRIAYSLWSAQATSSLFSSALTPLCRGDCRPWQFLL